MRMNNWFEPINLDDEICEVIVFFGYFADIKATVCRQVVLKGSGTGSSSKKLYTLFATVIFRFIVIVIVLVWWFYQATFATCYVQLCKAEI